jgi:hypothetical protein
VIRDDFDEFPRIDADDVERMLAHFRQETTFLQKRVDLFGEEDLFALEEFDGFGQSANCVADLGRLQTRFQTQNWDFSRFSKFWGKLRSIGVHFGVGLSSGVFFMIFWLGWAATDQN